MRYPIDNYKTTKKGYHFGDLTFYNAKHLGLDLIVPTGTPVYAPTDGLIISKMTRREGGLTVWFQDSARKLWRFLHLSKFANGFQVKEGAIIAYTGNTGTLSKGAHLHFDISKNNKLQLNNFSNFIDPEKYLDDNVANDDMTNTQFLHALYFGFYNRTPDTEGLRFWLNKMEKENTPASEVVRGLLSSDEAQKHFKYVI